MLSGGGDITSSIGFNYTDERFYTLVNTPSSKVDDYWISDLRITWHLANDQTSVSLWSTNIFDEVYIDTMLNQSGDVEIGGTDPSLGMTADYWGEPRRFRCRAQTLFLGISAAVSSPVGAGTCLARIRRRPASPTTPESG